MRHGSEVLSTAKEEVRVVRRQHVLTSHFIPRLNDLKGGGGQTWGMEMMELGTEMSLEDDSLLNLLRNRSGRGVESHLHRSPDRCKLLREE
ncbi:hypothetical protein F2Q68_00008414 [Brassica cretica]|uniref:Uncharacterized protein n=1 Tax=Brassica cretica TaxID=69181 RepID=A0A8S9L369_BRACR|nr:hypothetical protein F2Q68_00008414 [Brassica cretica]